ncbi:methylated-DNA--[protein]-cysteine S-methyltransferase [Microlunatus elymi]|uniref:Methylated-DNA--protein-cysteine methyltransferase n=2 Tax=Microlunatus elymi TaxID=2596828 RepID=A0A516Q5G8_9ACTN|nr:methylated-DNA--[protein]-cysteine S-methyltransferase [Microlunatus elymi]
MTTKLSTASAPTDDGRIARGALRTPVGVIGVEASDIGLRRVGWRRDRTPYEVSGEDAAAQLAHRALNQLSRYFAGELTEFDLPLDLPELGVSTRAVLMVLKDTVGYGQTITYGELADRSGALEDAAVPARAIGSIMGSNPVPIVIACHRVVASDGLGGYSGGEAGRGRETKTWLLEHEGALPPTLL